MRFREKVVNSPSIVVSGLNESGQAKMMLHRAIATVSKDWQAIRPRLGGAILSLIVCCVPVVALTWRFDVIDTLQARVAITALVALLPTAELMSQPRPLLSRGDLYGFGAFMVLLLLMTAGDKFEWLPLRTNSAILVAILPYSVVAWVLMGRKLILLCSLLMGLAAMMVYWLKAMDGANAPLELLLAPIPAFVLASIVWAPIARFALKCAQSHKNCPMAGPGTQVVAMLSLFLPVILIATFVPGMLDLSEIWSAVSLTIIGVLLSAVVAQPLRCFFLEWAELKLDKNGDG